LNCRAKKEKEQRLRSQYRMLKHKPNILLAEDDEHLGLLLVDYLTVEGFSVTRCPDGERALHAYQQSTFDICLFDVMMPKMDGFSLAKAIRIDGKNTPILFITAKSLKEDKLIAYGIGADDYITKPFDAEELLWKIKAIVRRMSDFKPVLQTKQVSIGKYTFDCANQSLSVNGQLKRITEKECEILNYLFINRNKVIKREELLTALWGENDYFLGRSLDVFITKIRRYLKEDPSIGIENVFGVGFIFNIPA
jgi:DNA-binding response OmpR family regulator